MTKRNVGYTQPKICGAGDNYCTCVGPKDCYTGTKTGSDIPVQFRCEDNVCGGCLTDTNCNEGQSCKYNVCGGCQTQDDCPSPLKCNQGLCGGCTSDTDCNTDNGYPSGYSCYDNVCSNQPPKPPDSTCNTTVCPPPLRCVKNQCLDETFWQAYSKAIIWSIIGLIIFIIVLYILIEIVNYRNKKTKQNTKK